MFEFLNKYGEHIKDGIALATLAAITFGAIAINTPEMPWQLQGVGAAALLLSIPTMVAYGLSRSTWN